MSSIREETFLHKQFNRGRMKRYGRITSWALVSVLGWSLKAALVYFACYSWSYIVAVVATVLADQAMYEQEGTSLSDDTMWSIMNTTAIIFGFISFVAIFIIFSHRPAKKQGVPFPGYHRMKQWAFRR